MKRDMGLVRKLLLFIEEQQECSSIGSTEIAIEGYSQNQIVYHLRLMVDGGLLDGQDDTRAVDPDSYDPAITSITWEGHEFLDSVRNEGVWRKVCQTLKPVGTASLPVIMSLATSLGRKELGLP